MGKKHKIYKQSSWSWFYTTFIHNTVNDNFHTSAEVLEKSENQEILGKIKKVQIDGGN